MGQKGWDHIHFREAGTQEEAGMSGGGRAVALGVILESGGLRDRDLAGTVPSQPSLACGSPEAPAAPQQNLLILLSSFFGDKGPGCGMMEDGAEAVVRAGLPRAPPPG